jgi:hypothetical protein
MQNAEVEPTLPTQMMNYTGPGNELTEVSHTAF